jgi:hypothetical protein
LIETQQQRIRAGRGRIAAQAVLTDCRCFGSAPARAATSPGDYLSGTGATF